MKILFIHKSFPGQFGLLANTLAQDPKNKVVFLTELEDGGIPGVHKVVYKPHRHVRPETHMYVRNFEDAVLQGQAAYRVASELKKQGFIPDVIYGHSGWGPTLYIKDVYPDVPFVGYFEWFYHAHGTDSEFGPEHHLTADDECRIRTKNAKILIDLYSSDAGVSPTFWQHSQFPNEFASKIHVMHDGILTDLFQPKPGSKLVLPEYKLDLSHVDELVTYVTRSMEPYRGFPQFMEAVAILQKRRPKCHVVIVGGEDVSYGAPLPNGESYKDHMLKKLPSLDLSRLHFIEFLPHHLYRQVLYASTVHVYLTRPFVLSWSFLDAMSTGCMMVSSATPPVQEVIQDGINGLLADFFSPQAIAAQIERALSDPIARQAMCHRARETVLDRYDAQTLIPKQIQFLASVANKKRA